MSFFHAASGITKSAAAGLVVAFDQTDYFLSVVDTTPANVQLIIDYDGSMYEEVQGGPPNFIGSWALPILAVGAQDYDIIWDQQSPSGPNMGLSQVNVWVQGAGGPGSGGEWMRWGAEDAGGGFFETVGILRIRDTSTLIEITSTNVTMDALGI
tara:strand:- start:2067 stop:2528 length:462 start_codon:yes stop_codon:yes gene_type:complete